MKLAVSNLAWAPADAAAAYAVLCSRGITGLEIAPGMFFHGAADPFHPMDSELERAVTPVSDAGLHLVSMQSLLFGASNAALFGDAAALAAFRSGMRRAIALARRLGIPNLVFGSPAQRVIPRGMTPDAAEQLAIGVFRALGDDAARAGARIAIEAVPPEYGTNFLNDTAAADAFVRRVEHPAVTLNFDLAALEMDGRAGEAERIASAATARISHVHISEPGMAPAPADAERTARALSALARAGYAGWYSVEMKQPEGGLAVLAEALDRLAQAVKLAVIAQP